MQRQNNVTMPSGKRITWLRAILSATLALSLLWSMPAMAAPQAQDDDPTPLLLGQLASGELLDGESAFFTFEAPDDALYVVTTGDAEEAEKFDIIITDEAGAEVLNDIFETLEVELEDGVYTIELAAVEDGAYSLFVTAQIGDLSDNFSRPGDLFGGSFYSVEELTTDTLYATVEIEETPYWQQAFIALTGGEDQDFSATIADDDFILYESIFSSLEEGPLTFFTKGGVYDLSVTPAAEGSSLTVVVLLSGPAPVLAAGEPVEGTITADGGEVFYVFTPSAAGSTTTVTLASESDDIDLDLQIATTPGASTYSSGSFGSNESVTFIPSSSDPLYVRVFSYDTGALVDPVAFTLTVEEGDEAPVLVPGEAVWGTVAAGARNIYLVPDVPAGSYITFMLNANPDIDLDLRAQASTVDGSEMASVSSASIGSNEVAIDYTEEDAIWQVEVIGDYADEDTAFVLLVRVEPAGIAGAQWATSASASSEFGADGYSAMQATGAPNVPFPSDNSAAWAPAETDGTIETLELTYDQAVVPTGVVVYESYNPGTVISIEAYDADAEAWEMLWEGNEPTEEEERAFAPAISVPAFATNMLRVTLDTDLAPGWNEIDAVQLLGYPIIE